MPKPITGSLEGMERLKKAVQPVGQVIAEAQEDVLESLGLKEVKPLSAEEKAELGRKERERTARIRQNVARMEQEIAAARKKEEQGREQKKQAQKRAELVRREKRKESPLERIIKSQMGTKEAIQRTGG